MEGGGYAAKGIRFLSGPGLRRGSASMAWMVAQSSGLTK